MYRTTSSMVLVDFVSERQQKCEVLSRTVENAEASCRDRHAGPISVSLKMKFVQSTPWGWFLGSASERGRSCAELREKCQIRTSAAEAHAELPPDHRPYPHTVGPVASRAMRDNPTKSYCRLSAGRHGQPSHQPVYSRISTLFPRHVKLVSKRVTGTHNLRQLPSAI